MSSLIDALSRRLPEGTVRCGVTVERLDRGQDGRWLMHAAARRRFLDARSRCPDCRHARAPAGRLLARVDPELGAHLGQISSTSCAIVSLAYRREQVGHALDGFGFVVPRREGRSILSGSFSSVKFPGRAPEGTVLLRAFLGGAFQPEILDLDDDRLVALAARDLSSLLDIQGDPLVRHVSRWPEVMPQYEIGHLDRVQLIEARVAHHAGLALAGNAYHGVGVPQCIQSGEQAAERIAEVLGKVRSTYEAAKPGSGPLYPNRRSPRICSIPSIRMARESQLFHGSRVSRRGMGDTGRSPQAACGV